MSKLALLRPDPLALKTIHEVKSVFTGTITEVEPLGGDHDKTSTV